MIMSSWLTRLPRQAPRSGVEHQDFPIPDIVTFGMVPGLQSKAIVARSRDSENVVMCANLIAPRGKITEKDVRKQSIRSALMVLILKHIGHS